ncbi:MAG: DUF1579 domain-containing protein [Planctomycetaceae bacterium]
MHEQPQKEHEWLAKLVGEWTTEMHASMGPDEPPQVFRGKETVRSLGGLWTIGEGEGDTPGGDTGRHVMTLGYDPKKGRYVGTFVASMMTHLWLYDGELDPSGKKLVLDAEGPSFAGDGTMAKYQDAIEFLDDDHRVLTSRVLGDDGQWTEFMRADYRRKK